MRRSTGAKRQGGKSMKRKTVFSVWLAFFSCFIISSCATPKAELTSVWKDQTYQGGYLKKVLVIGAGRKESVRRYFEDEFVRQLQARGTDAVASYEIIPFDKVLDKATITEKMKGSRVDSVLITKMLFKTTIDTYAPPKQPNWHEYYSESFGYESGVSAPKTSTGKAVARMEIKLYETGTEKPVWSALSDMPVKDDPRGEIKSLIVVLIQRLSQDRLIK
jgi:hypothetical protein